MVGIGFRKPFERGVISARLQRASPKPWFVVFVRSSLWAIPKIDRLRSQLGRYWQAPE
jgi:hypothetical protein